MSNRLIFTLSLALSLTSWAEVTVTAGLHGRQETVSLLFAKDVDQLNQTIVGWEKSLALRGIDVKFYVGAGELRRAVLHQEETGPGDVELFLDFPRQYLRPLRLSEAYRLLKANGVDVEGDISRIFGPRKKLDFFIRDQHGVENNGPYMSGFGTFFDNMGDTSLNQLTYSPSEQKVYGDPANLKALAMRKILLTELDKVKWDRSSHSIEGVGAKTHYKDALLRLALRTIRLKIDLELNPNPNHLEVAKELDFVSHGFEHFFKKADLADLGRYKFEDVYLEQFLKIFRNRTPEQLEQAERILERDFPDTLEVFKALGLDIYALTRENNELKALQGTANFEITRAFLDKGQTTITNPFADPKKLAALMAREKKKNVNESSLRPMPDWTLFLLDPELYYMIQHFEELGIFDRKVALQKYANAANFLLAPAKTRMGGKATTFREDNYGTFSFVNINELPQDKNVSLLDFIESQYRQNNGSHRASPTQFNQPAREMMAKTIQDAGNKTPVIMSDLDSTLYLMQERIHELLRQYDSENKTGYFSTIDSRDFEVGGLNDSLFRVLGPRFTSFGALKHTVDDVKMFILHRLLRGPAILDDVADLEMRDLLKKSGAKIVFLTARAHFVSEETKTRLEKDGFESPEVILRQDIEIKAPDHKVDNLRKYIIEHPDEKVVLVLEDDRSVRNRLMKDVPDVPVIRVVQRAEADGYSTYLMTDDDQLYPALHTGTARCRVVLRNVPDLALP